MPRGQGSSSCRWQGSLLTIGFQERRTQWGDHRPLLGHEAGGRGGLFFLTTVFKCTFKSLPKSQKAWPLNILASFPEMSVPYIRFGTRKEFRTSSGTWIAGQLSGSGAPRLCMSGSRFPLRPRGEGRCPPVLCFPARARLLLLPPPVVTN